MKIWWLLLIVTILLSACQCSAEIVKIEGTAVKDFQRIGAWGWDLKVKKVIEGPEELQGKLISVYLTSANPAEYPPGFLDPNIKVGDSVEAYGQVDFCEPGVSCDILLVGSDEYYLKRIAAINSES
ncbi:MAG: hypothetical protein MUO26_09960 [Methanotrichaceae archaeon]|nr:hypothetical protein [Methanotrichaceae archaeon]